MRRFTPHLGSLLSAGQFFGSLSPVYAGLRLWHRLLPLRVIDIPGQLDAVHVFVVGVFPYKKSRGLTTGRKSGMLNPENAQEEKQGQEASK